MSAQVRVYARITGLILTVLLLTSCVTRILPTTPPEFVPAKVGDFLYNSDSSKAYVPIVDSLVLVNYAEAYEDLEGAEFARYFTSLDFEIVEDTLQPLLIPYPFHLFRITQSHNLGYAIGELRRSGMVELVNPLIVYNRYRGEKYLTGQIVVQFYEWVEVDQIDSLNAANHIVVNRISRANPYFYELSRSKETGMDDLLVCQEYFESGLCAFAYPIYTTYIEQW